MANATKIDHDFLRLELARRLFNDRLFGAWRIQGDLPPDQEIENIAQQCASIYGVPHLASQLVAAP